MKFDFFHSGMAKLNYLEKITLKLYLNLMRYHQANFYRSCVPFLSFTVLPVMCTNSS